MAAARNICIGNSAGSNISSGNYNVVLGGHGGPTTQNGCFVLSDGNGTLLQDYEMTNAAKWTFAKPICVSNAAATGLTAGALAATTNASIVICDSSGQAYRIPCII